MNRVVIGVGSNIQPEENVTRARRAVAQAHRVLAESRFVETEPVGYKDQPSFVNGAVLIETPLGSEALKAWLRQVEDDLGRDREGLKDGPRTIDLDILIWNGKIVHREVRERAFVRAAVLEVWPDLPICPEPRKAG